MKIALITDQHFGGKSDSGSFNDYIEKFYTNQFFPYLKENTIVTSNTSGLALSDLSEGMSEKFLKNFFIMNSRNWPTTKFL